MGTPRRLNQFHYSRLWSKSGCVAIIRTGAEYDSHMLAFIDAAGFRVHDIHQWHQIDLELIDGDGHIDCLLDGIPIQAFKAFVYCGVPGPFDRSQAQFRNRMFIQNEREKALLTAMFLSSTSHFINRGFWIDFARGLTSPSAQLRMLSVIGWKTPAVIWPYDFLRGDQTKSRLPEPRDRTLLVLTRQRHILIPDLPCSQEFAHLITKTQDYMADLHLDWCLIPVSIDGEQILAYGFKAELPENLPLVVAGELVRDAIVGHA